MRKDNFFWQDGRLVYHKQTDPTPALESVQVARDAPAQPISDSWHVGRIDAHVLEQWLQEAGVKFSDKAAVRDVIRRKLMSSDNAAFRVKEGRF